MEMITGFESTNIGASGKDVFQTTRHDVKYKEDFNLLQDAHIKLIRYPLRWHKIEWKQRGDYDWFATDQQLMALRERNIRVIADPLHHTSISPLLRGGFVDPNFVNAYTRFCLQAIERYYWIDDWTPINEPYVTALLAGRIGVWHPQGQSDSMFAAILTNFAQAFVIISTELLKRGKRVIHFDAGEHHTWGTDTARAHTLCQNERRFLFPELVLGRLTSESSNARWLRMHVEAKRFEWFKEHSGHITEFGLNYYQHSEIEWKKCNGEIERVPHVESPIGFAAIAHQYADRLKLPVWLGETNLRGRVIDRLMWLKYMVGQCEQAGIKRCCWFPFIDSTDWNSLVTKAEGHIDPQGIYWLKPPHLNRKASELSTAFAKLSRGEITSDGLLIDS